MLRSAPRRRLLILLSGMSLLACGGNERSSGPSPVVTTIQVTPGADTLISLGDTRQLAALPLDAHGDPVAGVTIAWSSSAPGVATVNAGSGLVSAVSNGAAVISARVGTVTGTAALLVSQDVANVTVAPATASLTALGAPQQFTATAKDGNGNAVVGVKFLWLSSDPRVATIDTTGRATSQGPGSAIVTAAARGIPGNAGLTVTQVATQLGFTVQPPNAVGGDPFTNAVEVEVRDAGGALVAGARVPVTLSIAGDTLHGTTTVNSVGGIATFPGLWVDRASSFTLHASAPGFAAQASSAAFTVIPGPPAVLQFSQQPARTHAGAILAPVTIRGLDRVGNLVPSGFPVTVALSQHAPGALLSGTTSTNAAAGSVTINDLSVDSVGRDNALTATASFASVRSDTFVVTPALTDLSSGNNFSCGLTAAGEGFCWGFDFYGQQGHGSGPSTIARPTAVGAAGLSFSNLATGSYHTCGVAGGGAAYCWGRGDAGQLDNGCFQGTGCLPDFVSVGTTWNSLSAGLLQTCGLDTGGVGFCWGRNSKGSLGSGDTTTALFVLPTAIAGGLTFASISVSQNEEFLGSIGQRACGLVAGGDAYCWGDNTHGQLGIGSADTLPHATPLLVSGGHHFSQIVSGPTTCGVELNGTIYCWGSNSLGQLGVGGTDTVAHPTPTPVSGGFSFTQVAVGLIHGCGLTTANGVLCWGGNFQGQLGTGDQVSQFTPTPVVGAPPFVRISNASSSTCGLTAQNDVWCWGSNASGEIGDGTTTMRLVPTLVDP